MDTASNSLAFKWAVEAVLVTFVAVVAVALERFYRDRTLVENQRFADRRQPWYLFRWCSYGVLYPGLYL